jgi:hypothetical protein
LVVLPTASSASVFSRTDRQPGHFGDAAGVVRDRTIGIERDDHAGQREHGGGAIGDAERPASL